MDASAIQIELRDHERRLDSTHRTLGTLSTQIGDHTTQIAVVQRDVEEIRRDIADLKQTVEQEGNKNRATSNRVIGAMLALSVTAAGSAITVALTIGGHP